MRSEPHGQQHPLDEPRRSIGCRLGIHKWQTRRNDEGQRYLTCLRCGKDADKISLNDYADPGGAGGF
jgi:hypothetical protein